MRELYLYHVGRLVQRYGEALAEAGLDAVVLHAGAPKKRTVFDDQYFPLRPSPYVQHFVPIAEAHAALVVTADGARPKLLRPRVTSFWERPAPLEPAWLLEPFDVVQVEEDGGGSASHLPGRARLAFVGEETGVASAWGIAEERVNATSLLAALDALRVLKSPYEVACLAEANRRAAAGHDAVLARFRAGGASELDLHLAFLQASEQDDADTPYKNIVALGANAAILHHVSYGRAREAREAESLLLDAGASFHGYCSDITRTWVRGRGATASAFQALVDGVEEMQQLLCGAARVGLNYEALHDQAHRELGRVLAAAGVVRGSPDEAVDRGVTRAFLPHGLGHSLGLTCHDAGCATVKPRPDNPFLRNTSRIAEGQCFTIEPGVYFVDALMDALRAGPNAGLVDWALVGALTPLGGIRIEDDVVVRGADEPVRNLTREVLPRGGGAA